MSHRIYLYNFNHSQLADAHLAERNTGALSGILAGIGASGEENLTMVEWNYEFPIFLHALLIDQPFISTPLYNGDEGGIYAPAAKGKLQLKAFYNFIERHADRLIDDKPAFLVAKQKIFDFLDQHVTHDFFHLDAWDVFNMDDECHEDQAIELLEDIVSSNSIISEAIENDNPLLLDSHPDYNLGSNSFQNFRQQLNYDGYDFGWRVIQSGFYDDLEEEPQYFIIEDNGLFGIENLDGILILPTAYTFLEEIDDLGFVIKQNDKFGFFTTEEGIVKECTYTTETEIEEWIENFRIIAAAKAFNEHGGAIEEPDAADLHNMAIDAVEEGDMDAAFHYYELAAELGQPESMNDLGWYYATPDYYDENKIYYWYRRGAKAGSAMAMTGFALCHIDGVGIQQNVDKGIEWLLKAAELEDGRAHDNLGNLYITGNLVDMDVDKALYHYKQGVAFGAANYGRLAYAYYLKGDYENAIPNYQLSIDEGDAQSAFNLALLYELGDGNNADSIKALHFYHKAVELGKPESYIALIRMYQTDAQVKDEGKALEMIALAKAAGMEL